MSLRIVHNIAHLFIYQELYIVLVAGLTQPSLFHSFKIHLGHTAGRTSKVAIVILGGGLTSEGRVNPQVELRVQRALALYHELKSKNTDVALIPISAGTTHKPPPLDSAGFPITEAQVSVKK